MAASATVSELPQTRNLLVPRHGVVTLFGHGINVSVNRGHLVLRDGIATERYEARLPRIGHKLRRLVVIGSDGFVSLAAIRWLADQKSSFIMLERDGSILTMAGPAGPSYARLRRAQALAHHSGAAVTIARELIARKLTGQEEVARASLNNAIVADQIQNYRLAIAETETTSDVRHLESQAALAYWSAWRNIPINFPKNDLQRVPEHWSTFGTRHSPLTGSPRLAVNPANAILNYLYAILEAEARLAAVALGLDPGIGFLHADTDARDSLACDLMEVIRPQVDAYLLDWIMKSPFRRNWFFEQRDGSCRLMGSFAVQLSETALTWAKAVAPIAEWVRNELWSSAKTKSAIRLQPTQLTEDNRRWAKSRPTYQQNRPLARPINLCRTCGKTILSSDEYCASCARIVSSEILIEAAQRGRIASHTPKAEARRGETQRRQHKARQTWNPSQLPDWLTEQTYREKIQPRLAALSVSTIARAIQVSLPYATEIQRGKRMPHPRHWQKLGVLTE